MIYSEPLINQLSRFITSIGFGFIICVLYIAVKAVFRIISKKRWSVMLSDGVFCFLATFLSFFFMTILNSGQVRFNFAVGQLIGFGALHYTVGRFLLKIIYAACDAIHFVLLKLLYPLRVYFKAFENAFKKIFEKIRAVLIKCNKKIRLKRIKNLNNYENTLEKSE